MTRLEPPSRSGCRRMSAKVLRPLLSELHRTCFPDDPWPPQAFVEISGNGRFFWPNSLGDAGPAGLVLARALGEECEILTARCYSRPPAVGYRVGFARGNCEREARRQGARACFSKWRRTTVPPARLYAAAHGFVQIGRRANYYRRRSGPSRCLVLAANLRVCCRLELASRNRLCFPLVAAHNEMITGPDRRDARNRLARRLPHVPIVTYI